MENIPWHHEVVTFGEKLCTYLESYGLAAEHEHSNCILLAKRSKFFKDGRWNTWIDYSKFHQLIEDYYLSDGNILNYHTVFNLQAFTKLTNFHYNKL